MQVQIVIERGRARLEPVIYLKDDAAMRYTVEIPEAAVAKPRDWMADELMPLPEERMGSIPAASAGSLQEKFNTILGDQARIRPSASIGDDYQALMDAHEEHLHGR